MAGRRKSSNKKRHKANAGRDTRNTEAKTPTADKTRKPEQWSEFVIRKEGEREE